MDHSTARAIAQELFWRTWDGLKYLILLSLLSAATLGYAADAAEEHWLLALLMAGFYMFALYLGIKDLRSGRLSDRQLVGSLVLMAVMLVAVFALVSHAAYKLGLATYQGVVGEPRTEHAVSFSFLGFYWWQFFDLLPVLEMTETLRLEPPMCPVNLTAGVLVVAFRGVVILLFLDELKDWWQRKRDRSAGAPKPSQQPTEPAPTSSGPGVAP